MGKIVDENNKDILTSALTDAIKRETALPVHPSFSQPIKPVSPPNNAPEDPYYHLQRIVRMAYDQSASGKGKERHASSPVGYRAWHEQPILANARQIGPGGPAMQIMKKAQESVTMAGNGNFAGAKAEALGAIVYAAALYKLYEEMESA